MAQGPRVSLEGRVWAHMTTHISPQRCTGRGTRDPGSGYLWRVKLKKDWQVDAAKWS